MQRRARGGKETRETEGESRKDTEGRKRKSWGRRKEIEGDEKLLRDMGETGRVKSRREFGTEGDINR